MFRNNTCGLSQFGASFEDDLDVAGAPTHITIENNIFRPAANATSIAIDGTVTKLKYRYSLIPDAPRRGLGAVANCKPGCSATEGQVPKTPRRLTSSEAFLRKPRRLAALSLRR